MDPPRVLVAHPLASTGEAIAALLAELRPGYRIEHLRAVELDAAATEGPASVVVCGEPSPVVQARAQGWVALYPGGQDVALVGAGDAWRLLRSPTFASIVAAVDELVGRPLSPALSELAAR